MNIRRLLHYGFAALMLAAGIAPLHAAIKVEIDGVDADLRRNVTALLSVERYKDNDQVDADVMDRLYRRIDKEVQDALQPFGYYQPVIESKMEALPREQGWRVQINITPGPVVVIDTVDVQISGAGATDTHFTDLTDLIPISTGDQLNHQQYDRFKASLQNAAATYGYLDARLLRSELEVEPAQRRAAIHLSMETGERYRFGATTISQTALRESQMRKYLRYREGQPYDASLWLRTQFALDDSQLFSAVAVLPGDRDAANLSVPITITAEPAKKTYSLAAGYGTDTGIRGYVSMLNPRINDRGDRLQVRLQASEKQQGLTSRYDIPFRDPARERMSLLFAANDTIVSDKVETGELSLTPSVTQVLGRWERVLSVAATHTRTATILDSGGTDHQTANLVVPGITYSSVPRTYLGEDLYARALLIELLGSHTALGAKASFLRLDIQSEHNSDLSKQWHLLLRGQVGASAVRNEGDLPGQYRFFAGGDRSVRGFGYGELSPDQLGGKHLLSATVEIQRDLPRNFGLAAFFDVGNAFNRFGDPLAYSFGLGFRWRLPGITLGIDLAKALHQPEATRQLLSDGTRERGLPGPRLHVNISLPTLK